MTVAKVQMVKNINGILNPENFYNYIPMEKTLCGSYRPPNII